MFKIKIAGLVVEIHNNYYYSKSFCNKYICSKWEKTDFSVYVTKEEIERESAYSDGVSKYLCESLCIYRHIGEQIYDFDGFILHSAAVLKDKKCYMFLGKSGAGKSTHANMWVNTFKGEARILNGDKPIVRRINGVWTAFGTPWQGKEDEGVNKAGKIQACCKIVKAPNNKIVLEDNSLAVKTILGQVYLPSKENHMNTCLKLLDDFISSIPIYKLECNISEEAAKIAYNKMK